MGKRRRDYHDKKPYSSLRPDPRHWTRKGGSYKQKESYRSEDDAWEFLELHPMLMRLGYTVYQCPLCSLYHIGCVEKG